MNEIFSSIPKIKYEGSDSKNPLSFKYYNPDRVIMGKAWPALAWKLEENEEIVCSLQ